MFVFEFFWSAFSVFIPNPGKCGPEKLQIWTLFHFPPQWISPAFINVTGLFHFNGQ